MIRTGIRVRREEQNWRLIRMASSLCTAAQHFVYRRVQCDDIIAQHNDSRVEAPSIVRVSFKLGFAATQLKWQ